MHPSLPLLLIPSIVASLLISSPASAAPAASNAPTAQDLTHASTAMLSQSEAPESLAVSSGWRFTSRSGYPLALRLCEVAGESVTAQPVAPTYQVALGESAPIGSRTVLRQSVWVNKSESAAITALAAIEKDAQRCAADAFSDGIAVATDESYTFILQRGSAILSLAYTVPAGTSITTEMKRTIRELSKNLAVEWAAPVGTEMFFDPAATGAELVQAFFALLQSASTPDGVLIMTPKQALQLQKATRPFLDPAFQLVRGNGERYLATNYQPSDISRFEIDDVVSTEPAAGLIVARYRIRTPGATTPDSALLLSDDYQPRLTTFHWNDLAKRWTLLSHANFNSPVAAICNQEPIVVTKETSKTSSGDRALGESLIRQWRDITMGLSKGKVRHPANQIQLADGRGWPTTDGALIQWSPASAYEFDDLAVTRDGDLLVASYDAVESGLVLEGDAYRTSAAPRLLTYLRSAEGKWELIALANFNVPQGIPQGVPCVSSGS